MKRLIGATAIAAAATLGLMGQAVAQPPQDHPGAHPHHRHTPDGECHDMQGPDAGGAHGGRHWGAVEGGQVHHGSCAGAHPGA